MDPHPSSTCGAVHTSTQWSCPLVYSPWSSQRGLWLEGWSPHSPAGVNVVCVGIVYKKKREATHQSYWSNFTRSVRRETFFVCQRFLDIILKYLIVTIFFLFNGTSLVTYKILFILKQFQILFLVFYLTMVNQKGRFFSN